VSAIESTARLIDREVRRFIDEAYVRAMQILKANRDILDKMADTLLEREVLGSEEIDALIERRELPPRAPEKPLEPVQPETPPEAADQPAAGPVKRRKRTTRAHEEQPSESMGADHAGGADKESAVQPENPEQKQQN